MAAQLRRGLLALVVATSACGSQPREPAAAAPTQAPHQRLELSERVPLLGGRLSVRVPRGARAVPPRLVLFEGPPDYETRYELAQEHSFNLMAEDVFAIGTGSVGNDVRSFLRHEGPDDRIEEQTLPSGVSFATFVPQLPLEESEDPCFETGRFVAGALVESATRGLAWLWFHTSDCSRMRHDRDLQRAREVLGTLEGNLGRPAVAAQHRVDLGSKWLLVLDLPWEAAVTLRGDEDIDRSTFHKLVPLGTEGPELALDVGDYRWVSERERAQGHGVIVATSRASLLRFQVDWHSWLDRGQAFHEATSVAESEQKVHVFIRGSAADAQALRAAVEAAREEEK